MSNAQSKETGAVATPKQSSAPDGKSKLPTDLTDFPTPATGGGGDPGPSAPMPK
jgi:hypothetical protein